MKKLIIVLMASAVALCACNKHEDPYVLSLGTVTMKPTLDGSFYMKVTDDTALVPRTQTAYPFKESEKRLILRYADYGPATRQISGFAHTQMVEIVACDTIYTKSPVLRPLPPARPDC